MKVRDPYYFGGNILADYKTNFVTVAATTYTIGSTVDETGEVILFTSASAVTVTLAGTATIGTTITVIQMGAGQLTFAAGGSALLRNRLSQLKTAGQYAMVSLVVVANSGGSAAEWVISGDTTW